MKKVLLYLTLFLAATMPVLAQDAIPTKGKEFWMGFTRNYLFNADQSLDLFITSDVSTTGTVEMPLQGWSATFDVTANNTTTVTVPNSLAESFASEIVDDRGIFISTEDTVSVFAVNFKPISADGSKILPIQSLGTEYMISSYTGVQNFGSQFLIVATEDDTEIEIIPTALTYGGVNPGESIIINLDQGQTYQVFADLDDNGDMTGTIIQSTSNSGSCRPFAVFSGASCAYVPTNCVFCDHIFDQNFPTSTWGYDFHVVPFAQAPSGYTYRIMALEDDTQVLVDNTTTYDLDAGQIEEFNAQILSKCISSNKRICVTQYLEGISCGGNGDPSMLILNDVSQKIDNITFSTMESNIITNHALNVISETSSIDQVYLNGALVDGAEFTTFPTCPEFSYAQLDIPEGTHTLESENGITAYVYGVGDDESYAYSVGSFFVEDNILNLVDTIICAEEAVTLTAEPNWDMVDWFLNDYPEDILFTGDEFFLDVPIESGVYVAHGLDLVSGCEEEELFLVEYVVPPIITANDMEICKFESVQLDFTLVSDDPLIEYQWTPEFSLDDPTVMSPIASPLSSTDYTVTVTTPGGCGGIISETIEVEVLSGSISGLDIEIDEQFVCEGTEVQLEGSVQDIVFEDNFDPGISWGLWCDISGGQISDACGSVSGAALYFNSFGVRRAITEAIDVSTGGSIIFSLKVASGVAPCEDTDFGEDIILEYATDSCDGNYTLIETFLEFNYPDFTVIEVPIPPGAISTGTHFRWKQVTHSGIDEDNWALDNVFIGVVDNNNYEFNWYPEEIFVDNTGEVISAYPVQDTLIHLEVLDAVSGCAYMDSIPVSVHPNPDFTLLADSIMCDPLPLMLEPEMLSVGDYDFLWTADDGSLIDYTDQQLNANPLVSTSYSLLVADDVTGCADSSDFVLTISELESIELQASEVGICQGETVSMNLTVDAQNPYEVFWSASDTLEIIDDLNVESQPDDIFWTAVEVVEDSTQCFLVDTVEVDMSFPFELIASEDVQDCNVIGLMLEAEVVGEDPNNLLWNWTPGDGLATDNSQSVEIIENSSNDFIVSATNQYDCFASDTVHIVVVFDDFDLGEDMEFCEGESFVLETGFDNGNTFVWNNDPMENNPYVLIDSPGQYSVFIESPEGCTFEDEVEVAYFPNPFVDIGQNQSLCEGETAVLNAGNPGLQYLWSTEENSQSIEVDETGYYWVQITDANTCVDIDSVYIGVNPLPVVEMPDSLFACDGQDIIIDAGFDGEFYNWSNEEETSIIIVEDTGLYSVVVTNEYGCESSGATYADFGASPEVVLPPDAHFCEGGSVLVEPLVLTEGDIYWNTGDTSSTLEINQTGFYILTVENEFCSDADAVSVSVHPIPTADIPDSLVMCFSEPPYNFVVNAYNEGATYQWNTGETSSGVIIDNSGYFVVDITSEYGCVGRETILVEEHCMDTALYIPNSFTPNGDGDNDTFVYYGRNIGEFKIQIFDRWGIVIFETNDITEFWDGSFRGRDHYVIKDTYTYVVEYRFRDPETGELSDYHDLNGFVTVVR